MAGRWNWVTAAFTVPVLLRSPSFHAGVRRVHRVIDEKQNGPHPGGEPMRPGEATEEQGVPTKGAFLRYFVEELGNQAMGTPTPDEHLHGSSIENSSNNKSLQTQEQEQPKKWKKKKS
ncbi:hypothetical protein PG988_007746 [Apiospora saccharicola]